MSSASSRKTRSVYPRTRLFLKTVRAWIPAFGGMTSACLHGGQVAPDASNRQTTFRATPRAQAVFRHAVPGTADQHRTARRANGIFAPRMDVSFIDKVQASFQRDAARAVQCFRRRGRAVLQFKVRMKRGEMEWNVRAQIPQNPFGQVACLIGIVVQPRNHEIGNFKPDLRLIAEPEQCIQHRLHVGQSDLSVELLGKGL